MPDAHEVLRTLSLVLCVAAATTLVCQWLRQPVIFGYLIAGVIVGPHIPIPLVADEAMVHTMAELGVVLLMFALGLEFSLRKLFAVGATASLIAVLQSTAMMSLGFLAGQAFGWTTMESLFSGAIIAVSSTTIIVKAFAEQRVTGRFTQVAFGVLIIQDLIAILLLAVLTAISAGSGVSAAGLLQTAARLGAFLVGLVVVGLLLVPRLFRLVTRLNRPETTTITAVAVCFGGAYVALSFGYSVALGAFLAGSLVAESGEEKVIEPLIGPVRDMFAAIFFVAVGMLIDPRIIAEHWVAVLVFTAIVIGGNIVAVTTGAFVAGYGTRTSIQTGMSLAQIGEFSFIIAGVGLATHATRDFLYPVAVAVSAITTLTTPWLIRASGSVASFVDRRLPRPIQNFAGLYGSWMDRVRAGPDKHHHSRERRLARLLLLDAALLIAIVVGTSLYLDVGAEIVERMLGLSLGISRAVVIGVAVTAGAPLALGLVRLSRALGQALAFRALPPPSKGRLDLALAPRRAFTVAWQLAIVCLVSAPLLAVTRSLLPLAVSGGLLFLLLLMLGIAFWRSATNLQGHTRAGAEVIVAALAKQMAGKTEVAEPATLAVDDTRSLANVYEMIPGLGEPVPLELGAEDYGVGRSLTELDLRDRTDATVLVIVGREEPVVLPVGREVLRKGDTLALAGTPDAVKAARVLLTKGP